MRSMKPILSVLGVTALLLGPIGLQIPSIGATEAFAGGGNGNGNSGGNGNGGGKSNSKASTATSDTSAEVAPAEGTRKVKKGHGLLASELKGLNAAHANPNALANASPNSQVGRLATYRNAAVAAAGAQDAIDGAIAALAEFDATNSGRSIADIEADIAALDPTAVDYDPAQLEILGAELSTAQTREADRIILADAVATAEESAGDAADTEAEALLAAANGRTLSPEAIAYLRELLNI